MTMQEQRARRKPASRSSRITPSRTTTSRSCSSREGDPQKAIDLETRGMALDPKNPRDGFFLTLGRAYFMLGDNDAAIEWSLKSLEKNPAYPQAYASLAMAYAAKQAADQARAA